MIGVPADAVPLMIKQSVVIAGENSFYGRVHQSGPFGMVIGEHHNGRTESPWLPTTPWPSSRQAVLQTDYRIVRSN